MDLGKPTNDDANLVKNNQTVPQDQPAPSGDQPTAVPPSSPSPSSAPPSDSPNTPSSPSTDTDDTSSSPPPAKNDENPIMPSSSSDKTIPINTTPKAPAEPSADNMGVGKPNIGVELDEESKPEPEPVNPASAEPPLPPEPPKPEPPTEGIDVPINKYSKDVAVENQSEPPPAATPPVAAIPQPAAPATNPMPPIKAAPKNAAGLIVLLAFIAIGLGSAGGFFGFKYLDRIKSSASELGSSPTPSSTSTTTATYSSTKYGFSFTYPKEWFINTTSASADSVIVAQNQVSLEGTATGYKVAVDFQSNDGKTLKAWVDSYVTTSGETRAPVEITVSGASAYQQQLTKNGPAIATYIPLADTIMIVTYTAPVDAYAAGQAFYNQIISSFKVTE